MKKPVNGSFGVNVFTQAFQEFDEDAFFENLHNKVKNKSYFQKYKGFKATLVALSYLFNVASALSASYGVYWLTNRITGVAVIGWIVACIFLFFLEKVKRKSSSEFWQVYFFRKEFMIGWFALSVFCFGISLGTSAFGVKEGTETLSPDPELIANDSTAKWYIAEAEKLESTNEDLRNNRDPKSGVTFYNLNPAIAANTQTAKEYRQRASELEKKLEGQNEKLTTDYIEEIALTAWTLVWFTVLMELLFEACLCYVWYYLHRSYVERAKTKGIEESEDTQEPLPSPDESSTTDLEEIKTLLKTLIEAQILTKQGQVLQVPNPKLNSSKNGLKPPSIGLQEPSLPIGFFTQAQRTEMNRSLGTNQNECGHIGTHEDTAPKILIDDRFTVPHTYTRGKEKITVHYTARMVKSRVGEYERKVEEAENKPMAKQVIENRKAWLVYWQNKWNDLLGKQSGGVAA